MKSTIAGVRIAGLQAAIPSVSSAYFDEVPADQRDDARKVTALVGVQNRRIAPQPLMTADLCLAAAETLLADLGWERDSIGALVFVSQGADYSLPATACLLQHRLKLPVSCAAFDVELGCSGYVYGLWIASQLLAGSQSARALVLVGDISTRVLAPGDSATAPLFGDAGSATALEKHADAPLMHVVVGTDGGGGKHISIEVGGARHPADMVIRRAAAEFAELARNGATPETDFTALAEYFAASARGTYLHLNGPEVFSFTLKRVPPLLADLYALAGCSRDAIDMFVMHQANQFMLEHLRKKAGIPADRFLLAMRDFGNTSSASIPLALCAAYAAPLAEQSRRVLLAGFGVGWSWSGLITEIGPIPRPGIIELGADFQCLSLG